MSHVTGQLDADLHHEDGSHRSTPPTADGRRLEQWEARIRRHLETHAQRGTMQTPHEAVSAAVDKVIFADMLSQVDEETRWGITLAVLEALHSRARTLDPDHSPPSYGVDEWETWCDGYNTAVSDILGEIAKAHD